MNRIGFWKLKSDKCACLIILFREHGKTKGHFGFIWINFAKIALTSLNHLLELFCHVWREQTTTYFCFVIIFASKCFSFGKLLDVLLAAHIAGNCRHRLYRLFLTKYCSRISCCFQKWLGCLKLTIILLHKIQRVLWLSWNSALQ